MNARGDVAVRRHEAAWDAAVAGVTGTVYWWTLLPGLGYSGDTAIFQFVGHLHGLPHGPGYPLYLVINLLWTRLLPVGSLAFRANLLSALLAALACVVLRRLLRRLGTGPGPAAAAAVTFGFTPTFWSQAIVAEVYTLHALLVAATLLLLNAWAAHPGRRGLLVLACAVYALSFGNHLTAVTLLPAVAFAVWRTDPVVVREGRTVAAVAAVTFAAALQYLLVAWRAADPSTPYLGGTIHDPASLVDYLTGGSFRGRMFAFSPLELLTERIPFVAAYLAGGFGPLLALVPLGWLRLRRTGSSTANGLLLLVAAGNTAFALGYDIGDLEPFLIPTDLAMAVWLGLGLAKVVEHLRRAPGVIRAALVLAVPTALLASHLGAVSRRGDTGIEQELERALAALPSTGAAVLTPNYPLSAFLWYELLANGWQERGVFIMPHYYGENGRDLAGFVRGYLTEGRTYQVEEQRLEVPAGLPVYCFCSAEQRQQLASGGLRLVPFLPELWTVVPAPQGAEAPTGR